MTRKHETETIDRESWEAMLANLDGDLEIELRSQLSSWQGGDSCQRIRVYTDSLGRLDSESNPVPA